jgi:hypothetical protein
VMPAMCPTSHGRSTGQMGRWLRVRVACI